MKNKVKIFDSTLRDGAQAEGISFTVDDKIKIAIALDNLGISYLEAGNPGSNPKDLNFFKKIKKHKFKNLQLVAFGSTRRKKIRVEEDQNVQSLISAHTPVVAIFGKSWDLHASEVIKCSLEENLSMIQETIAFFKKLGKEVIYDAEHFYDGYKNNPEYALKTLNAAVKGGADCLVLCDTNGGSFPLEIYEITKKIKKQFSLPLGMHCHNDTGFAVANSIMGVEAGATQVQGTYLGFGERCGNANLSTIIPNLQIKKNLKCIPKNQIKNISSTARYISEIANLHFNEKDPYIGHSSFAHKGGMHIDGVSKISRSFEHIDPGLVGNERKFLMSEVAGRGTILAKIKKLYPEVTKDTPSIKNIIDQVKSLENQGYQFEAAESSFELLIKKQLGHHKPFFKLEHFRIIGEKPVSKKNHGSSAIIKIKVDQKTEITASEGDGPVHALDTALRKALEVFYPALKNVHLTDYKVRVLNAETATAAKVRVLIESTDGKDSWTTIGVSTDIIEASWIALVDSIEYKLYKDLTKKNLKP